MKYILVTGGVISGIGKGLITSSLGLLLKSHGIDVTIIKIDPYLNIDAGTLAPTDHGEVFVLDDGGEVDMDLGNYERFLNINLTKKHNITTGRVYSSVIQNERKGGYLGKTVQVVPHITNCIQEMIEEVANDTINNYTPKVCLIELGGTIGDIESAPFVEALRQLQFRSGTERLVVIHVSLLPTVNVVGEQKTKPTQASVKELRSLGLVPEILICRSSFALETITIKEKLAMFCNLSVSNVINVPDCKSIYHIPLVLKQENILDILKPMLHFEYQASNTILDRWATFAVNRSHLKEIHIVLIGKYTSLKDSYISVICALEHATFQLDVRLKLSFVESCLLETENPKYQESWDQVKHADGIIIPGGFGTRGTEGIIRGCEYARVAKVPFLGICMAFHCAIIEFSRNVLSLKSANSQELDPNALDLVVSKLEGSKPELIGGTMRLGLHPIEFIRPTTLSKYYNGQTIIHERHRHRYEFNSVYIKQLENAGLYFVAKHLDGPGLEILELDKHPFYVAAQFHPELKSRPLLPAPLFVGFMEHAILHNGMK